jgi:hypothetical protein
MFRRLSALLIIGWATALPAAENRSPAPGLPGLCRKAAFIFDGTVLQVHKLQPTEPDTVAQIEITFQINRAIRGVRRGQVISIREWIGLWTDGDRYRRGERLLLFLYPRSKLGLTSPVAGDFGKFNIDDHGDIVLEAARVNALSSDPVLRAPLRGVPRRDSSTVRATEFRRAISQAMENR